MNLNLFHALQKLHPSIIRSVGDIAYDEEGNEVSYDMAQAQDKLFELEAAETAKTQAALSAKESALAKLAKLGLTEDEVKSLLA